MGGLTSRRLLAAGYELVVHDLRAEAVEDLVAAGAEAAKSPAEVAGRAELVRISSTDAAGGAHGRARPRRPAARACSGPTSISRPPVRRSPWRSPRRSPNAVSRRLDAPVSGGVRGAIRPRSWWPATGALPERARPLLEVFGRVFHVGERPGLGQLMKLANNSPVGDRDRRHRGGGRARGQGRLDPATMLAVINASTGRNTASEDKFPPDPERQLCRRLHGRSADQGPGLVRGRGRGAWRRCRSPP